MPEMPDAQLLEQFVRDASDDAFTELVQRHVGLVHSVALRTTNPQHAEDITQAVFVILARKAGALNRKTILPGWLYHTARLTAANWQRGEMRRTRREQEAFMQSQFEEPASDNLWRELLPQLDQAMASLGATDRDAIVLRYFQNKGLAEVGQSLGLTENAVQKRVHHALQKLRKFFLKRGVNSTAGVIAETISAHSVQGVPAALAKSVASIALAKGAGASLSTTTIIKGALKIMAWSKAKAVIVATVAVVLTAGVSVVVVQKSDRIQGKTESEWVKSIQYFGDDNQLRRWHALGPRGVRMLVHALQSSQYDRATRMCIASVLCQLEPGDKSANSDLIRIVQTEKEDDVLGIELSCFEGQIKTLSAKDKAALFPALLDDLQHRNVNVRNNALVALQDYPEQAATIVPLMVNALQDDSPLVRVMAVTALLKVDPENPASANFVSTLAWCITNPPGTTPSAPNDAVILLGELHPQPDVAVPVLIQALHNGDSYVRANAAAALGRFGGQAKSAVPALTQALNDSDSKVKPQAAAALRRINSNAPPR